MHKVIVLVRFYSLNLPESQHVSHDNESSPLLGDSERFGRVSERALVRNS